MTATPGAAQCVTHLGNRAQLRHAHPRHHARGADRARADADLDRVRARVAQRLGRLPGRDIAADHLHPRVALLDRAHPVDDPLGVTVRGVDHDHVDPRLHQRIEAFLGVRPRAHRGAHPQAPLLVLAGLGMLGGLLDVLDGHETPQVKTAVDHQHLLDAVLVQEMKSSPRESLLPAPSPGARAASSRWRPGCRSGSRNAGRGG